MSFIIADRYSIINIDSGVMFPNKFNSRDEKALCSFIEFLLKQNISPMSRFHVLDANQPYISWPALIWKRMTENN